MARHYQPRAEAIHRAAAAAATTHTLPTRPTRQEEPVGA
jgi:hypothetical protein